MKPFFAPTIALAFMSVTSPPVAATCWADAAAEYNVPEIYLHALAKVESNFNPRAVGKNVGGSYDLGLVQINSTNFDHVEEHLGFSRDDLFDPCKNLKAGAWIFSDNVKRLGWTWDAIGAYNVGCAKISKDRCTQLRTRYARKIFAAVNSLQHSQATEPQFAGTPLAVARSASPRPEPSYVSVSLIDPRDSERPSAYFGDRL